MREASARYEGARSFETFPVEDDRRAVERNAAIRREWQMKESFTSEGNKEMGDFAPELSVGFELRKGEKRKQDERGEDMILADKETGLTGVFDGLGGEGKGDIASAYAAARLPSLYKETSAELRKRFEESGLDSERETFFDGQVSIVHDSLRASAREKVAQVWKNLPTEVKLEMLSLYQTVQALDRETKKTGGYTTLVVGKTVGVQGKLYEVVTSIGDSGAAKVRKDGTMRELTTEDSAVDQLLQDGMLTPEQAANPDFEPPLPKVGDKKLTVRDLRRRMYQAIGQGEVEPRVTADLLRPGEQVVYLTDGIRDEIVDEKGDFDPKKAAKIVSFKKSALTNAVALNREAAKGDKRDDKAVLIKEVLEEAEVLEEMQTAS